MKRRIIFLLPLIALGGCASMSVDDCATADWRALGFADGSRGETLVRTERRANDCAAHGYAMDRATYDSGRHAGLGQYCTLATAYRLGESGRSYNGVCGAHDEGAFLASYNRGLELYTFTSAVSSSAASLRSAQIRHDELDALLDKYSSGYRDEGLTMQEHNEKVLGIWAERKYLENEAIPYWIYASRYLQEQLDEYRVKVAAGDSNIGSLQPREFPGPNAYTGPTGDDAREMMAEVLSGLQS